MLFWFLVRSWLYCGKYCDRFCQECIVTALRSGNKECPTCRKKLVSKRSLRPDPNFDALINKIYPNRDDYNAHQERVLAARLRHSANPGAVLAQRLDTGPHNFFWKFTSLLLNNIMMLFLSISVKGLMDHFRYSHWCRPIKFSRRSVAYCRRCWILQYLYMSTFMMTKVLPNFRCIIYRRHFR